MSEISKKYEEKQKELNTMYPAPNDPEYKEKKSRYMREKAKLEIEFMNELLTAYKVSDNPKGMLAYTMAWESSHSEGFNGVENHFAEHIILIK